MTRTGTVVAISLLLLALPILATAQTPPPDRGVRYVLHLTCPEQGVGARCPVVAVDGQDAMGDPALAVDPDRPQNMIIASLHGTGDNPNAPSNKSRSGQVFTTFTTQNSGAGWVDNPYFPPAGLGGTAYGEHPAITIDPYGHVFVGSLYALPGEEPGSFDYVIAAQKFRSISDIDSNQDGSYRVEYLRTLYPGNAIRQMWFVYNRITDNMTMVWTEQTTEFSGQRSASSALLDGLAPRLAPAPAAQAAQARSMIGVAWTSADTRSDYHAQPRSKAIGPCETSTNPVIAENWLYVGCKVAAGEGEFGWDPAVKPGQVVLFRMHPDGGDPQYLGPTPLEGGKPKLGVRSDGRIAVMTADVQEGRLRMDAAYGKYQPTIGRVTWAGLINYGDKVLPQIPSLRLVDANIQDMIYREYSGVIHMVLKQVVEPTNRVADQITGRTQPTIQKAIVAIDEKHGLLAQMGLDVGNILNRTQDPSLMQMSDDVFNDLADDFLELPPAPHEFEGRSLGHMYQREFFAVGDYGTVIFAEIIEETELRGPGFAGPPPPPPPPIPAPAPAATTALASAAALTASALMSGAAIAIKRKHITGAKKGP